MMKYSTSFRNQNYELVQRHTKPKNCNLINENVLYLRFNSNFDEAADDREHVADDEQDIPAVYKLHSV